MKDLIEKLIVNAFEEAEKTAATKTKNGYCEHIKLTLEKKLGHLPSDPKKSFTRCYNKYIEKKQTTRQPSKATLNLFSKYLGYEDYQDFVSNHIDETENKTPSSDSSTKKTPPSNKRNSNLVIENNYGNLENIFNNGLKEKPKWLLYLILSIITICVMVLVIQVSDLIKINNQCMAWTGDRFNPVDCDEKNITIVSFDKGLVNNFRKVALENYINKNPEHIRTNGVWRGKSANGKWDYFTAKGRHPITQEPLENVPFKSLLSDLKTNINEEDVPIDKEPEIKGGETNEIKNNVETSPEIPKSKPLVKVEDEIENDENLNRLGIFIFDEDKLDLEIRRVLETSQLNAYNTVGAYLNLTTTDAKHRLASGDFSFLNLELLNRLDYLCTGKVSYSFTANKNATITCKMTLTYDLFDRRTGLKLKEDSKAIHLSSIGFDESTAKANVIKKIGDLD